MLLDQGDKNMPIEQENKADFIKVRDIDLKLLSSVNAQIDSMVGAQLVVTGSYAIEALASHQLKHEDMDANVLASNLSIDIPKVVSIMENLSMQDLKLQLFKSTYDRLEYDVLLEQLDSRRLELQFVEAERVEGSENDYRLKDGGIVPTVIVPLKNSKGQEYLFRIKSLSYAIATWAIRISGVIENPKRQVRQSDLEHLKLLLSSSFQKEDVIFVMSHHPQMPSNMSESEVFNRAMERLKL